MRITDEFSGQFPALVGRLQAVDADLRRALELIDVRTEPGRCLEAALAELNEAVVAVRVELAWLVTTGRPATGSAADIYPVSTGDPADGSGLIGYLDALAQRVLDLPGVAAAAFVLGETTDRLIMVAHDTPRATTVRDLCRLRPGPAGDTNHGGQRIDVTDLAAENRWPLFATRANAAGFGAVWSLPVRRRDILLGALVLFGATPGPLPPDSESVAARVADIGAVGILLHHAHAIGGVHQDQMSSLR